MMKLHLQNSISFIFFFSCMFADCAIDEDNGTLPICSTQKCKSYLSYFPVIDSCTCEWDRTLQVCYENNLNAKACHEKITESHCSSPDLGYLCVWDATNNRCRANCASILDGKCFTELGCVYSSGTINSCISSPCSRYEVDEYIGLGRCASQFGCKRVDNRCTEELCQDLKDAGTCTGNPQCDWHEVACVDQAGVTCTPCKRKQHSAGGMGDQQCNGFGTGECSEHVVCKYDGENGCQYKGDGSLVTKVGITTAVMVVLLLLFAIF